MPYDGIMIRAVTKELSETCTSGKINKIHQPKSHDIVMNLRCGGENHKLILSANPSFPRIHFTNETFENPLEPPMFCMLLRKHCEGGVIESIRQVDMERIIHIDIKTRDELGDWTVRRLVVEIMGRHSNIILTNPEENKILDGIHHVTPSVSQHRQVLPGREYVAPPAQNKRNPLTITRDTFLARLDFNAGKLDRQIVDMLTGVSPLVAKEIRHRAGFSQREPLWNAFAGIRDAIQRHEYEPQIITTSDQTYFTVIELRHLSAQESESFATISRCLESYFAGRAERAAVKQQAHDWYRRFSNEINKNRKKIQKLQKQRKDADKADRYQLWGELLTAYMHQVNQGDHEAHLPNYYEEDQPLVTITMDPKKTPAENAQHFYKRYNKLKKSAAVVEGEIQRAEEENQYFETILQQLENASLKDLGEIREELSEQGYFKKQNRKDKRRKRKKETPSPEQYTSSEGVPIYVGKNNKQNEYLTSRIASSTDTWLHTKEIPGSHVVIRSRTYDERTLHEAAMLAALNSKAKDSSHVPVDYTLVKHVRKPKGGKPGFVIYDHQKTVFVTPDAQMVQKLKT